MGVRTRVAWQFLVLVVAVAAFVGWVWVSETRDRAFQACMDDLRASGYWNPDDTKRLIDYCHSR